METINDREYYKEHLQKAVCHSLINKEDPFTGMREQIDTHEFGKFASSFIARQIFTHLEKGFDSCIPMP
jgi:hypothetical protein